MRKIETFILEEAFQSYELFSVACVSKKISK